METERRKTRERESERTGADDEKSIISIHSQLKAKVIFSCELLRLLWFLIGWVSWKIQFSSIYPGGSQAETVSGWCNHGWCHTFVGYVTFNLCLALNCEWFEVWRWIFFGFQPKHMGNGCIFTSTFMCLMCCIIFWHPPSTRWDSFNAAMSMEAIGTLISMNIEWLAKHRAK